LNLIPKVDDPVEMCDNTTTIHCAKDPQFHQKTKYIKKCYHFVRYTIKANEIAIKYISTIR